LEKREGCHEPMKRVSIYNNHINGNREKRVYIENELRKNGFYPQKNGELVIIIGGDGTFLSGIKKKLDQNPVFAVLNAGNLGFFTEFNAGESDINSLIKLLKKKQYVIEEIPLYEVHMHGKDGVHVEYFINEVNISEKENHVIHMVLEVNGEVLLKAPADDMLISSMYGSTAHTLSAGGALSFVPNALNVVMSNPIMNKVYRNRVYPTVIPDSAQLTVFPSVMKKRPFKIICDSQEIKDVHCNYVTIRKSEKKIKMLRTKHYSRIHHIYHNMLNFE